MHIVQQITILTKVMQNGMILAMLRSCIIFTAAYATVSLRSLAAPNHVFCVTQTPTGTMTCNPLGSFTDINVACYSLDQISKHRAYKALKVAFEEKSNSALPVRDTFFGKTEILLSEKEKKENATHPLNLKSLCYQSLYSLESEFFFYRRLKAIQKCVKPIAMYEVEVLSKIPESDYRYSVMMFCQNIVASVTGIGCGNLLTPLDFKVKIKLLNLKSNFIAYKLHERNLTDEEMKLGRIV